MTPLKLNYKNWILRICFFAMLLGHFSFSQDKEQNYYRFIDSADIYLDDYYKKAMAFLDSIPPPFEQTINGRLAEYYSLKALIHDGNKESAAVYQSYLLALKYAKKEHNYIIAGDASLELFANSYYFKRDTTAYKYLEKAKEYYKLSNVDNALFKINQTYAYAKFLNGEYEACNILLLKHIDAYRNLKEDAYYYLFATYMLTSNYIYLRDFKKAYSYFAEFKTLKKNPTIVKYNYLSFKAGIHSCFADIYFQNKQLDSTFYHMNKLSSLRDYMSDDVIRYYFKLNAEVYKSSGKIDESKHYIDSLLFFEEKTYKNIVDTGYQLNDSLLRAETDLETESKNKFFNRFLVVVLLLIVLCTGGYYVLNYKKHKHRLNDLKNKESNLSYLKSNNEKLVVKVHGLETFINDLKKDVKEIAAIDTSSSQREKIKQLYNGLHLNATTLINISEGHTKLVNDSNVDFFNKIQKNYPQLNDSEIIICYYLFVGFKNKKIAIFLNTTLRAVESKRYRISKKMDFNRNEISLLTHLKETFKDVKMSD